MGLCVHAMRRRNEMEECGYSMLVMVLKYGDRSIVIWGKILREVPKGETSWASRIWRRSCNCPTLAIGLDCHNGRTSSVED